MNISLENGNAIKSVIISNIITLLVAAITLIWNFSSLTSSLADLREDMDNTHETQLQIIREQNRQNGRIIALENRQIILQANVTRLEGFHLGIGGPASWPDEREYTLTDTVLLEIEPIQTARPSQSSQ